jgi:hypothetical protein
VHYAEHRIIPSWERKSLRGGDLAWIQLA